MTCPGGPTCRGLCGCGSADCGDLAPGAVTNRPGLAALAYRAGTYGSFVTAMIDRLSAALPELRTRDRDDPAVALLDAGAVLADVLTFYQERIANEGYLRTATERRSVVELANLVGYRPRPGVAASVYLAFTLDPGYQGLVPAGTRATSLPAPGQLPQPYETSDPIEARADWNVLQQRLTRPQVLADTLVDPGKSVADGDDVATPIYLAGTQTRLGVNDPLLVGLGDRDPVGYRVREVLPEPAADRTVVRVEPWSLARSKSGSLELARAARRVTVQTLDLDAYDVGSGRTVQRVVRALEPLTRTPDATWTESDLTEQVDRAVHVIAEELEQATRMGWARLQSWLEASLAAFERLRSGEVAASPAAPRQPTATATSAFAGLADLADVLAKPRSQPPASPAALPRSIDATYAASGDALPRLLAVTRPDLGAVLYQAWDGRPLTDPSSEAVYALRVRARLYGNNAPARRSEEMQMLFSDDDGEQLVLNVHVGSQEIVVKVPWRDGTTDQPFPAADETVSVTLSGFSDELQTEKIEVRLVNRRVSVDVESRRPARVAVAGCDPASVAFVSSRDDEVFWLLVSGTMSTTPTLVERPNVLSLDASYPQILPGSWVAVERPDGSGRASLQVHRVLKVADITRDEYDVSAVSTQLLLDSPWLDPRKDTFDVIRQTTVFAQSEELPLAPTPLDPIDEDICGDGVELNGLYTGLQPGRWLVVTGQRSDITGVTGVDAQELVMLAAVEHVVRADLPGETTHTVLRFANPLAYCYRRDTAVIFGNVAAASHGETRTQVLGSGDASASGQAFGLRQKPLTYTAAATETGVQSSLQVRVNDVLWHEAPSFTESAETSRYYVTVTDEEQASQVRFGDGIHGARLPTGVENVTAVYRTGIGPEGNLPPSRITQLATRPLGVKGVVNPVASTGGAGPDSRDAVRRNAPLGVTALDRLVSVRDHADFALTFAGIGKAAATKLSDGRRQLVYVTIAGVDDIPITPTSALFGSLVQAFHRFGDPHLPVELAVRERLLTVISAKVTVLGDYLWALVEPKARAALVAAFGFDRRELGQDLALSEVVSVIQRTEGVAYVDVDVFAAVDEAALLAALDDPAGLSGSLGLNTRITAQPARIDTGPTDPGRLLPAQLAYVDPLLPETILLSEALP